jgi:hypothetical protein
MASWGQVPFSGPPLGTGPPKSEAAALWPHNISSRFKNASEMGPMGLDGSSGMGSPVGILGTAAAAGADEALESMVAGQALMCIMKDSGPGGVSAASHAEHLDSPPRAAGGRRRGGPSTGGGLGKRQAAGGRAGSGGRGGSGGDASGGRGLGTLRRRDPPEQVKHEVSASRGTGSLFGSPPASASYHEAGGLICDPYAPLSHPTLLTAARGGEDLRGDSHAMASSTPMSSSIVAYGSMSQATTLEVGDATGQIFF